MKQKQTKRQRNARNDDKRISNRKTERNNYQDAAEEREYRRGMKAGEDKFMQGKPTYSVSRSNDPSWYAKNQQMLNDSASFSFNTALGTKMRWDRVYTANAFPEPGHFAAMADTIPGLMSLKILPTVGRAYDATSPVNIAAQNVYSYVRYQNSGAANYDAPDLMLYLIAMDSLYACWNWMKRIYGLVSCYSQTNRYRPVAYAAANGVDLEDVQAHLADFRGYLNKAAAQISAFCVPATMSYNIRHSWLYSNVFMDGDTNKAQEYIFVPGIFYQFSETTSENGGELVPINVTLVDATHPMPKRKFSDLQQMLDGMINALMYSEDIGIMSGDILKAYGEGNLFHLSKVDPDYSVAPVFSKEVLSQIENTLIIGVLYENIPSLTIAQNPNTNFITYNPIITLRESLPRDGFYLNMHMDSPSPADVMVATRLSCIPVPTQTKDQYILESVGSEFVCSAGIYYFTTAVGQSETVPNGQLELNNYYLDDYMLIDATSGGTNDSRIQVCAALCHLSHFDWHPQVSLVVKYLRAADQTEADMFCGTLIDWDKYAFISAQDLEEMHAVALMSEFNVPTNGPTF